MGAYSSVPQHAIFHADTGTLALQDVPISLGRETQFDLIRFRKWLGARLCILSSLSETAHDGALAESQPRPDRAVEFRCIGLGIHHDAVVQKLPIAKQLV